MKGIKLIAKSLTNKFNFRNFAIIKEELPSIAESIKDVTVIKYLKEIGEAIEEDEEILEVETHKGNFMVRAKASGVITKWMVEVDKDVEIGTEYVEINTDAKSTETKSLSKKEEKSKPEELTSQKKEETTIESKSRLEKEKAVLESKPSENLSNINSSGYVREEKLEKMSRIRKTVSERLKQSQNTYAQVTTFQEVDMGEIMKIRKELGEEFQKKNGLKLGFMSFFIKACAKTLQERPLVNSVISDDLKHVIHRNFVDISVAVSSPKGLVVPVIRDVQLKSFANVEQCMVDMAKKAAENKIAMEDMEGGTFTISNGGVFGSMLSAPIINPPQSAILGMHNIVNRPVVRGNQIVAKPIMYLSLSYDHRLLDGREGAGFLKRVSDLLEDPRRMLLEF